ncbi:hypothetical protein FACS1894137_01880 [Spirochaetia bacterium]|nr:hypothetical protein FACS1894137_01880 [Spirochaetia bacterium]
MASIGSYAKFFLKLVDKISTQEYNVKMVNYKMLNDIKNLINYHLLECLNLIILVKNNINGHKEEKIIEPFNLLGFNSPPFRAIKTGGVGDMFPHRYVI